MALSRQRPTFSGIVQNPLPAAGENRLAGEKRFPVLECRNPFFNAPAPWTGEPASRYQWRCGTIRIRKTVPLQIGYHPFYSQPCGKPADRRPHGKSFPPEGFQHQSSVLIRIMDRGRAQGNQSQQKAELHGRFHAQPHEHASQHGHQAPAGAGDHGHALECAHRQRLGRRQAFNGGAGVPFIGTAPLARQAQYARITPPPTIHE